MQIPYLVLFFLLCSCSDSSHTDQKFGSPTSGLDAFGGHLAGFNFGEWGGKLVFFPSKGDEVKLLDDNVVGIFRMPNGVVVLTGLSHLTGNRGTVYSVLQNPDKSISTKLLLALPGAPYEPMQMESGEVLFGVRYAGEHHARRALFKCYLLSLSASIEPSACGNDIKFEL